jgi:hypothetical protein
MLAHLHHHAPTPPHLVVASNNEKDSPTVDLTVRPLSGVITASTLLNSNGGAKVKTSGNLGDFTLLIVSLLISASTAEAETIMKI